MSAPAANSSKKPTGLGWVKEFLTSVVIAFAMAFVSMAFVIRGFVIPTGSMAPTLLGAHIRVHSPRSGADWPVTPQFYAQGRRAPLPVQGSASQPIKVHDPFSGPFTLGRELRAPSQRLRSGDRVFALRYLPGVSEPERFDPVVFVSPTNPDENVIKRLIGLPREQVALLDGDAFVRQAASGQQGWGGTGWSIARKPERLQRTLWYPFFDSSRRSSEDMQPWRSSEDGWNLSGKSFTYEGQGPTRLTWDARVWPIDDFVAHNEAPREFKLTERPRYPVSDLRLSVNVANASGGVVRLGVGARRHEFMGEVSGTTARVAMRAIGEETWTTLDERRFGGLGEKPRAVEFWHVDQALWLFVDGELVAGGPEEGGYSWTPEERLTHALGLRLDQIGTEVTALSSGTLPRDATGRYSPPTPWLELDGPGATLHRVSLARDIFWRPDVRFFEGQRSPSPGRSTHPATSPPLDEGQYFLCGDNSTDSNDGRTWGEAGAVVRQQLPHAGDGVVPRELLIGRAFIVYLPALNWRGPIPVPDFGRMRLLP